MFSAEKIHADELLAFVSKIQAPGDLDALLKGELFPEWALGDWELAINELHVNGVPPFGEIEAKLALRSRELLLSYAKAKWLGGFVSTNGSLSLGQSEDPKVRLHKFAAKVDQVEVGGLTSRVEGRADAQLTGRAQGSDWGETLRAFSGEVALTSSDGSLHLGPQERAGADGNLPKTPWSLKRLGELLEGKVSVSEPREVLLAKMDSALEVIQYVLFKIVGRLHLIR